MMQLKQLVLGVAGAAMLAAAAPQGANAQLWYNGQFNYASGLASYHNVGAIAATTYDNFIVTGSGWTLTSLFGDFLTNFTWSIADYEIRSGVSDGDGGTLLFSGLGVAASSTATGRTFYGLGEYRLQVDGLNIFLGAGTYWLGIAPIGIDGNQAYVSTTSGINGVNATLDASSAFFVPDAGIIFEDDYLGNFDYAYGVDGFVGQGDDVVPEPATMTLLATGLMGMAAARRRKKTTA